jgi:hypothetical protein
LPANSAGNDWPPPTPDAVAQGPPATALFLASESFVADSLVLGSGNLLDLHGQSSYCNAGDITYGSYNEAGYIDHSAAMAGFSDQTAFLDDHSMGPEVNGSAGFIFAGSAFSGEPNQPCQGFQTNAHSIQAGLFVNNDTAFEDFGQAYQCMQSSAGDMQFIPPVDNISSIADPNQTFHGMQAPIQDMHAGPLLNNYAAFGDQEQASQSAQALPVPVANQAVIPCTQQGCIVTFKRDTDRIRHEATVHHINQVLHLCQVLGCPKGQGRGYSRADKLTEHMWKKHGNLGYVKRV